MYLRDLTLTNFKNYEQADLHFNEKINCFVGDNGVGKTNLLDAIHYLSFCKSFFNPADNQNIRHDEVFFLIKGNFINADHIQDEIACLQKRNQRKQFKINKKEYDRLSDHIGLFPQVMISPADSQLINGGSEERRRFIDTVISQFDKAYLDDLIIYNRALLQRNRLLKSFASDGSFDMDSLESWNSQLIPAGMRIYEKRAEFVNNFIPLFNKHFSFISKGREEVSVKYDTQLFTGNYSSLLSNSFSTDRVLQYTSCGIHKDDLLFSIGDLPIRKFGSQGQQKSFCVAIRLTQFEYISQVKKFKPILLLDDIFDKLDEKRVRQILLMVANNDFGQIFITDTHKERIILTIEQLNLVASVYNIGTKGEIEEIRVGNEKK